MPNNLNDKTNCNLKYNIFQFDSLLKKKHKVRVQILLINKGWVEVNPNVSHPIKCNAVQMGNSDTNDSFIRKMITT